MYEGIKYERTGFQPRLHNVKSKSGEILSEKNEIINRWKSYFEDILNGEEDEMLESQDCEIYQMNTMENNEEDPNITPPEYSEVTKAIKELKNNKAPGEDSITPELIKSAGFECQKRIHQLILKIWENEALPDEWRNGIIIPIHKKGSKLECTNYRPITLLNVTYKILSKLINTKLKEYAEQNLSDYQCGFRPNRSTTDHIFTIRRSMEKCMEYNTDLHMLFVDFKQAFDSINRAKICEIFEELKIPRKLTRLVTMTLKDTKAKVLIQSTMTEDFEIKRGVKQGDELSTTIFNLILHHAIKDLHNGGHIMNRSYQILAYADDVTIMARSSRSLVQIAQKLFERAKEVGLRINEEKTKY